MTAPPIAGTSHIALTVTDMDASAEWYQRVFGWKVLRRFGPEDAGTPRVLLLDPTTFFVVALCQPVDGEGGRFDYRRTGLDHLGLLVADADALDRWLAHLDELGIEHSPERELDLGALVTFDDPDGIQLELWLNAT